MQKEPGLRVRGDAVRPTIAQVVAILLHGHPEIRRPPGGVPGGNRLGRAVVAVAQQGRLQPPHYGRRQQFLAPVIQVAALINIQGFRVIGENPGQVKIVDPLLGQIPADPGQQRITLCQKGSGSSVGFIGYIPLLRARRFGRRRILVGLQKMVILGPGPVRQPGQHCRTAIPEPGRGRQRFILPFQPTAGAMFFQVVGRLRCRQFMIPSDNFGGDAFLPVAVQQPEKG